MNILQWLAGADKDILEKCSKSEKVKIEGFGALVLIPAIVGFISMGYAISTVVKNPIYYIGGATIWFLIVLMIDRFIISTMYKSRLKNSSTNFFLATIARYAFAILIGLAVSHPMTLLWFDGAITEYITLNKNDDLKVEEQKFISDSNEINESLEKLYSKRDCLEKLKSAEVSGARVELECGFSTGKKLYGPATESIQKHIDSIDAQISRKLKIINPLISNLNKNKNKRVNDIEVFTSYDYLKRVKVLDILMDGENGDHIKIVYYFIIIFFIFLDILPITMKISTAYGEYESYRDTEKFKVLELQKTEREILSTYAKTSFTASAQAKYQAQQKVDELSALSKSANNFVLEQERERRNFSSKVKEILSDINNIKDETEKRNFSNYIINSRAIFNEAVSKAQRKFLNYLKEL